jgi:hypothetical protein
MKTILTLACVNVVPACAEAIDLHPIVEVQHGYLLGDAGNPIWFSPLLPRLHRQRKFRHLRDGRLVAGDDSGLNLFQNAWKSVSANAFGRMKRIKIAPNQICRDCLIVSVLSV